MLKNQLYFTKLIFLLSSLLVFSACSKVSYRYTEEHPTITQPLSLSNINDRSDEFASLFCMLSSADNCHDFFYYPLELEGEIVPPSIPPKMKIVIVPGIFGECIMKEVPPFEFAIPEIEEKYIQVSISIASGVSGRASSSFNSARIKDYLNELDLQPDEKLVVIGYSKGVTDFLHYMKEHYPTANHKIDAFVSIAGVVNGTAIADKAGYNGSKLTGKLPIVDCPTQDESGIQSLSLISQFKWLTRNQNIFDQDVKNYSIVTSSTRENTSLVFIPFYKYLWKAGGANDGQVNVTNQVLPKSDVLGYFNSDHWAIILPFDENPNSNLGVVNKIVKRLATKNKFPRIALLEAIVLFVGRDIKSS